VSGGPPRPRPRAVSSGPAQPYPPASDFVPPPADDGSSDTEPFPLVQRKPATLESLADQIGQLSAHLGVVHKEAALARVAATDAADRADAAAVSAEAARGDVAELRRLVLGDHAPRITQVEAKASQVEAKTSRITIPPSAKVGIGGASVGGVVVLIAEVLWPLAQKWLETR
jgi:hypothetical protein